MKTAIISFVSGLVFAAGLVVGQMTDPRRIEGFLNPFDWDPTLAFVMVGAVVVHFLAYRIFAGRPSPFFATKWYIPTRRELDAPLVIGAALFGLGWGLAGICPAPGVVGLTGGSRTFVIFAVSMLAGMWLFRLYDRIRTRRA